MAVLGTPSASLQRNETLGKWGETSEWEYLSSRIFLRATSFPVALSRALYTWRGREETRWGEGSGRRWGITHHAVRPFADLLDFREVLVYGVLHPVTPNWRQSSRGLSWSWPSLLSSALLGLSAASRVSEESLSSRHKQHTQKLFHFPSLAHFSNTYVTSQFCSFWNQRLLNYSH